MALLAKHYDFGNHGAGTLVVNGGSLPTDMGMSTQQHDYFLTTDESRALIEKYKNFNISFSGPDAEDRPELERFIYNSFRLNYGAQVRHFMPLLVSLRNTKGDLIAVCGFRNAGLEKLFLETYLDEPIDAVLSSMSGKKVARDDVVEVGNFASFPPGMSRHMIPILAAYIHIIGAKWTVFTATPRIRNAWRRLGINLAQVCKADKEKLDCDYREEWGSYYDACPYVVAVNVPECYSLLHDNLKLVESRH